MHSVNDRNSHWKRIAEKNGYYPIRIASGMSNYCALSIEMAMIKYVGLENLSNMKTGDIEGYEYPPEVRAKMSRNRSGKIPPPMTDETRKKLSIINSRRIISSMGEVFDSGKDAESFLRMNGFPTASRGNISSCVNGKMGYCYGRAWEFHERGVPDAPAKSVSPKAKQVIRSDGMEFPSATHAAKYMRENGHPRSTQGLISSCCRGERKSHHGYSWKYK